LPTRLHSVAEGHMADELFDERLARQRDRLVL
jgi:hypothetical protein